MRKNFGLRVRVAALVGIAAVMGSAAAAHAGTYGETESVYEAPAPAPAARMEVEHEADYARPGVYLGGGFNYAFEMFDEIQGAKNIDVDNTFGFDVFAGYRLHPNFAAEGLFQYHHEFDMDPNGHYGGWSMTANGKAYILTGRIQPFVLAGLGYIDIDKARRPRHVSPPLAAPSGNDFVMRFGGGVDFYINEMVAIGPEAAYVLPFGQANNLDMTTLSLDVRFRF
jgi:hypothetical protein